MTTEKPYYEVKLVAVFDGPHLKIGHLDDIESGPALAAIRAGEWAEVNIPYHTAEAIYCFAVTIANKPAHEPAITEMLTLQRLAAQLYADYGDHAEPMVFGGPTEYPIGAAGETANQVRQPQMPDEAEALALLSRAFAGNPPLQLEIHAADLFALLGLIQFATRGLPAGHRLIQFARDFGGQFAEALVQATGEPELRRYIEMGWNPAYDVAREDPEG